MFTTKALFSEVPCPHQQTCFLPRCIFSHSKEETSAAGVGASTQSETDVATNLDEARKRRKLTDDNANHKPLTSSKEDGLESQKDSSSQQPNTSSGKRTEYGVLTDREISPPPLRKKLQTQTPAPVKPPLTLGYTSQTPSKSPTTKAARKTPVKAPIKQESLNPRAVRSAPASHDIRFRLVRALHEHFNRLNSELAKDASNDEEKLFLSEQELITKALDIEEQATLTPSIYSNVVKNKILVYKRMTVAQWKDEREKDFAKAKAAEAAALSDTPVSKPVEPPKPIETGLGPAEEIKFLPRLYTHITGLSKHGYVTTLPTQEEIEKASKGVEAAKGWEVCDRCKTRFQVFPGRREDGSLTSGGSCTYHYGKPYWTDRSALDPHAKREKKYRCCGQSMGDSPGCTKADSHVFKISEVKRMAAVLNFEQTPDNPEKLSANPVCIDGEMGYTVYGLELVRLTATSWPSGDELFDVLVKPIGQILDLNSRYSGVWPADMAKATPWDTSTSSGPAPKGTSGVTKNLRIVESPSAARALLFSHLSPKTPIIGHGLENDLNATRIIHPVIVDTALLFPHKAGLPYRNGLKMLMHTHLNRHIQVVVDGKMEGHDSKEDANAAGDLVRFSVGNEWGKMKRDGWTLRDGEFVPPPEKGARGGLSVEELELEPLSTRKRSRSDMEVGDVEVAERGG